MSYFELDIPAMGETLSEEDYEALVHKIKSNFLGYVSMLDTDLTIIISELFLKNKYDFPLWANTVFDDDRTSFGSKIVWLGKILTHHDKFNQIYDSELRAKIHKKLNEIRILRNDFAHTFSLTGVPPNIIQDRKIMIMDFEEGMTTQRTIDMQKISEIIKDRFLRDTLGDIEILTIQIRNESESDSLRNSQQNPENS